MLFNEGIVESNLEVEFSSFHRPKNTAAISAINAAALALFCRELTMFAMGSGCCFARQFPRPRRNATYQRPCLLSMDGLLREWLNINNASMDPDVKCTGVDIRISPMPIMGEPLPADGGATPLLRVLLHGTFFS